MRYLRKPDEKGKVVFLNCVTSVDDDSLKRRLVECADLIETAEKEFEVKVITHNLNTIIRDKTTLKTKSIRVIDGKVTVNELKNVYTQNFVPVDSPGRVLYDKLILSAPRGKCPLCGHRNVSTIDHYLPKAYYPLLSVVPVNLIPSCKDCNTSKRSAFPTAQHEETLHPYYDDVEKDIWLKTRVIQSTTPSIQFFVDAPPNWDQLLKHRTEFHFDSLSLDDLYSIEAATELAIIEEQLKSYFVRDGVAGVQNFLLESAGSRQKFNLNSWQTAMYIAIANDHWFCNGGFKLNN